MIKERPRRLELIYINQPLYFVTFATRDRKRIPSLDDAQIALEQYVRRAIENFNVALGRYVIMPDHIHLFVRGGSDFTLSSWIGGQSARYLSRWSRPNSGSLDSSITFYAVMKAMPRNGIMFARTRCAPAS
jgi:REP element-mobilizing transposase RayT